MLNKCSPFPLLSHLHTCKICMELLRFVKLLTPMASTFSGHELMTGKMEAGNYSLFQEAEDYGMTGWRSFGNVRVFVLFDELFCEVDPWVSEFGPAWIWRRSKPNPSRELWLQLNLTWRMENGEWRVDRYSDIYIYIMLVWHAKLLWGFCVLSLG